MSGPSTRCPDCGKPLLLDAEVQSALLGGVPWMTGKGRRECIPPVYAEHVGLLLMAALTELEVAA